MFPQEGKETIPAPDRFLQCWGTLSVTAHVHNLKMNGQTTRRSIFLSFFFGFDPFCSFYGRLSCFWDRVAGMFFRYNSSERRSCWDDVLFCWWAKEHMQKQQQQQDGIIGPVSIRMGKNALTLTVFGSESPSEEEGKKNLAVAASTKNGPYVCTRKHQEFLFAREITRN